jgi:type I restriction-modification system DNA methylase subunit
MREADLKQFVKASREFFKSFESQNFKDLSTSHIQKMIDAYRLTVSDLTKRYSRKLKDLK